jgi:hypothetical protein
VERSWRWCRRNPVIAGLAAAIVLALLMGTGFSTHFAIQANTRAQESEQNATFARIQTTRADQEAATAKANERTAIQEKLRADGQAAQAEAARQQAERQRDRADWLAYSSQIALAQREWQDGHVAHARDLLDVCRWDFRHFEHRYLTTLFNSNQRTFLGHANVVHSVAFSPDGKRLASTGEDGTVKVWETATGHEARTLQGHTGWVVSVVFSPDGNRLASASQDGTVKVWEANGLQE